MASGYFNYRTIWPDSHWSRRSFVRAWWRLNARDRRWVPPDFSTFLRHVQRVADDPNLRDLDSRPMYMEALPGRPAGSAGGQVGGLGATFEEPVAATIVQIGGQPHAAVACLSLLHCANDEETLERLLGKVMEQTVAANCTQFVAPTGPIPQWNSGALQDFFHVAPPLQTPYNPPYVPDLLASIMEPFYTTVLYHVSVPDTLPSTPQPARIGSVFLASLTSDLLGLLSEALARNDLFSGLDAATASVLVSWLGAFPVCGWAAYVDDTPVGFVLVQPDLSTIVRMTGGGRLWPQRLLLAWRKHSRTKAGRVLLGVVGRRWQGRGIGRQLWHRVLQHASENQWETLFCGPVDEGSAAATFLEHQGGISSQRYMLYRWSPW